jgi:hypothetical protein
MSVPTGVKEKNGRAVQHSTDVLNGRWKIFIISSICCYGKRGSSGSGNTVLQHVRLPCERMLLACFPYTSSMIRISWHLAFVAFWGLGRLSPDLSFGFVQGTDPAHNDFYHFIPESGILRRRYSPACAQQANKVIASW